MNAVEKESPTYVSYVIRIPQQNNEIYNAMFYNDMYDHFYHPSKLIVPWIFKAEFYLTDKAAKKQLEELMEEEPSLIAEVKEVRLNLYSRLMK